MVILLVTLGAPNWAVDTLDKCLNWVIVGNVVLLTICLAQIIQKMLCSFIYSLTNLALLHLVQNACVPWVFYLSSIEINTKMPLTLEINTVAD